MPELLKRMNVSVKNPNPEATANDKWLPLGLMGADLDKAKYIVDNLTQSLPQDWDKVAYKDMLTPYTQENMVATRDYTIGNYICIAKKLYKVTNAITTGTTLSTSTNIKEVTITDDYMTIYDKMDSITRILAYAERANLSIIVTRTYGKTISRTNGRVVSGNSWIMTGGIGTSVKNQTLKFGVSSNYLIRMVAYNAQINMFVSNNEQLAEAFIGCIMNDEPFEGQSVPINASWAQYVLAFKRVDGQTMTESDKTAIDNLVKFYYMTDKTLSADYIPADAKATGSAIGAINSDLTSIVKSIFNAELTTTVIESGTVNVETGANQSSSYNARRTNTVFTNRYIYMESDTYKYRLVYFNGGATSQYYEGKYTDFISGTTGTYISKQYGDRAKIVFKRADDEALTESDLQAITLDLHIKYYEQTDISGSSTQFFKRNNPVYVAEICALAQDWYSHRNDLNSSDRKVMTYGYTGILDTSSYTRQIDCSTFVGMLLRGYSFEQTPYHTETGADPNSWTGNTNYVWAINPFDWVNYSKITSDTKTRIRTAAQLAEWMVDHGQKIEIDEHWSNIYPGDILFFARRNPDTNKWVEESRYLHINHVAICVSKERVTGISEDWDAETYPWRHTFAEVGHEDELTLDGCVKIRVLEEPQNSPLEIYTNNINTLILVCRPDLGSI